MPMPSPPYHGGFVTPQRGYSNAFTPPPPSASTVASPPVFGRLAGRKYM
jgi:hypothetical protein